MFNPSNCMETGNVDVWVAVLQVAPGPRTLPWGASFLETCYLRDQSERVTRYGPSQGALVASESRNDHSSSERLQHRHPSASEGSLPGRQNSLEVESAVLPAGCVRWPKSRNAGAGNSIQYHSRSPLGIRDSRYTAACPGHLPTLLPWVAQLSLYPDS